MIKPDGEPAAEVDSPETTDSSPMSQGNHQSSRIDTDIALEPGEPEAISGSAVELQAFPTYVIVTPSAVSPLIV